MQLETALSWVLAKQGTSTDTPQAQGWSQLKAAAGTPPRHSPEEKGMAVAWKQHQSLGRPTASGRPAVGPTNSALILGLPAP